MFVIISLRSLRKPLRPLRFNFYRKDARGIRKERNSIIVNALFYNTKLSNSLSFLKILERTLKIQILQTILTFICFKKK